MDINGKIKAIETGLLPVVRIEGEDVRWPMAERMDHYKCPAVSVAVIEDGAVEWEKGYGTCDLTDGGAVDDQTMFMGASISKPVAAAVVMTLVEDGTFDLDTDVNTYLKSWTVPENDFTRQEPVTLRWLLSHKAGTNVHGFGGRPPSAPVPSLVDVLSGKSDTPAVVVDKVPGGTGRYSGGGYTIAQLAIEDATGKSFADIAQERILGPLGMTRTTFTQATASGFRDNVATGHYESGEPLEEKWLTCVEHAAGGIWTTAGDYARFMVAVRDALLGRSETLMKQDTARTMLTDQGDGDQGLGWRLIGSSDALRIEHGGSNNGFQTDATLYLDSGKGAVVLTSSANGLIFYWEILNAIADLYDWLGFLPPPKRVIDIPADQHHRYTGDYKIVSGVEMPMLKIWSENGVLMSEIPGMRGGPREILARSDTRFFNRVFPHETEVILDDDGQATALEVLEGGETVILRAERIKPQ